jgi:hypothetical protein
LEMQYERRSVLLAQKHILRRMCCPAGQRIA